MHDSEHEQHLYQHMLPWLILLDSKQHSTGVQLCITCSFFV